MRFSPKNAPEFYTAMIQFLREGWVVLFHEPRHIIVMTNSPSNIICDDHIIIEDMLSLFTHVSTILHDFSYAAQVFTKCRLFFKLSKHHFFNHALNMSVTILLLVAIVPLLRSLIYYKTGSFHSKASRFYLLSLCVASIIDIVLGSKLV